MCHKVSTKVIKSYGNKIIIIVTSFHRGATNINRHHRVTRQRRQRLPAGTAQPIRHRHAPGYTLKSQRRCRTRGICQGFLCLLPVCYCVTLSTIKVMRQTTTCQCVAAAGKEFPFVNIRLHSLAYSMLRRCLALLFPHHHHIISSSSHQ